MDEVRRTIETSTWGRLLTTEEFDRVVAGGPCRCAPVVRHEHAGLADRAGVAGPAGERVAASWKESHL